MSDRVNSLKKVQTFDGLSIKSYPHFVAEFLAQLAKAPNYSLEIDLHHPDYLWIVYGDEDDIDGIWFLGIDEINLEDSEDISIVINESSASFPVEKSRTTKINLGPEEDSFEKFRGIYEAWVKELKSYDDIEFVNPLDNRRHTYQKEYEVKLEFLDSSSEHVEYFDIETQLKLDEYFKYADKVLNKIKTKENSEQITEIQKDFNDLSKNQTLYSKAEIKIKLAKTWTKCREVGVTLAFEVTKVIVGEVFKKLLLG